MKLIAFIKRRARSLHDMEAQRELLDHATRLGKILTQMDNELDDRTHKLHTLIADASKRGSKAATIKFASSTHALIKRMAIDFYDAHANEVENGQWLFPTKKSIVAAI